VTPLYRPRNTIICQFESGCFFTLPTILHRTGGGQASSCAIGPAMPPPPRSARYFVLAAGWLADGRQTVASRI